MEKVFLVYGSWGMNGDEFLVSAFLDEEACDKYIEKRMIPRKKELEQMEICDKCNKYEDTFLLENECPRAKIKTDRWGKYFENQARDEENDYWKVAVDIIG